MTIAASCGPRGPGGSGKAEQCGSGASWHCNGLERWEEEAAGSVGNNRKIMQIYAGIFCASCWGTKCSSKNGPAVKRQLLSGVLSAVLNVGQSLTATLAKAKTLQPPYLPHMSSPIEKNILLFLQIPTTAQFCLIETYLFVSHLFLQLAQSSCACSCFNKKKYIFN